MDETTPVRKARGQAKGGQKLFSGAGAAKAKGTGEEEEEEEELLLLTAEGATLSLSPSLLARLSTFPQLTEPLRRKGLWEERLLRVQRGQRVGRLRLPHRLVSLSVHIAYRSGCIYMGLAQDHCSCSSTTISFCKNELLTY